MASLIYLDTHVVAWLFAGRLDLIPAAARTAINDSEILISPMAMVELQYLFEIRRTEKPARSVIEALGREIGLQVCDLPFLEVATQALDQAWTRDPFDRFIVSQAMLRDAPLVTKDEEIHEHYAKALWTVLPDPVPEPSSSDANDSDVPETS